MKGYILHIRKYNLKDSKMGLKKVFTEKPNEINSQRQNIEEKLIIIKTIQTWSIGLTMLSLAFGCNPYVYRTGDVYFDRELSHAPKDKTTVVEFFDSFEEEELAPALIQRSICDMLKLDRKKFPGGSVEDVDKVDSKDWNEFRSFVSSCLKFNSFSRPTAAKLLEHPYLKDILQAWNSDNFSKVKQSRRRFAKFLSYSKDSDTPLFDVEKYVDARCS